MTEKTIADVLEFAPRAEELATRLEAAGPKAAHVSASETHEIADFVHMAILALRRQSPEASAPVADERAALEWYAEHVAGCRKLGPDGDAARQALDKDGGERARAALASAPVAGEAAERLDAPAQVGGTRFGKGIHWSTVIQAAQRHHQYMQDPAREAERIAQAKKFQALVAGDSAPQVGPVAGEVQERIEQMAVNRYRPVPDGKFSYKVVAGDGSRSLYTGTKDSCLRVAAKLTEAFLDGAFVASDAAPQASTVAGEARPWSASDTDLRAWAERHGVENILKFPSTIKAAIDDARSLHLVTQPETSAGEAQKPVATLYLYKQKGKWAAHVTGLDDTALNLGSNPVYAAPRASAMPPLNDAMRAVISNERDVYQTPEALYAALCDAARDAHKEQS